MFAGAFTLQAFSNSYFLYYLALAAGFVVVYELTVRSGPPAGLLRVAGLACRGIGGHSDLRRLGRMGVRVRPAAVQVPAVRTRTGRCSAPTSAHTFQLPIRSICGGSWLHGDEFPERQLFPGLVTLIAAAAALWPGRRRSGVALLYGALAAAALVLSLGPEPAAWSHRLPSGPYLWLARVVPGMDGMRVPARLGVVVLMALCVLAALGIARLTGRLTRNGRLVAAVLLGIVVFAEGWAVPLRMAPFDAHGRPGDRAAYRWLAQQPRGAAIELPIPEWAIDPTLTYQYATLFHGHPIVNGYSGYGSSLQEFLGGAASPLNELEHMSEALEALRAVGVQYVLIHPGDYAEPAAGVDTVAAIRAQPKLATEAFRSEAVTAFRLQTPPRRARSCPRPGAGCT